MAYYSNKMAEWAWTLDNCGEPDRDSNGKIVKTVWKPIVTTKLLEPIVTLDLPAVCADGKWTTADGKEYPIPADNPDFKPPCEIADKLVEAYNNNMMREEALHHYKNEVLLIANDLDKDGKHYHADWIRKLVAVCDDKLTEAKPTEAVIAEIGEAADGLD